MLNLCIFLLVLGYALHLFYDNMPYDWFDKFGSIVKKVSIVLPAASIVFLLVATVIPETIPDAKAAEPVVTMEYLEKELASMRKDIADMNEDIVANNDEVLQLIEDVKSDNAAALEDLAEALTKAQNELEKDVSSIKEVQEEIEKQKAEEIAKQVKSEKEVTAQKQTKKKQTSSGGTVYIPSGIYLRSDADGDSKILLTIPAGSSCTYLGEATGWYHVNYKGTVGYVSRRLTERR